MKRGLSGRFEVAAFHGEEVRAFVPNPLPPSPGVEMTAARRRLLEQAAIPHRVQVSGVDEDAITDPNPAQLVQLLAHTAQTLSE